MSARSSAPRLEAVSRGYNFASTREHNAPLTEQQQAAIQSSEVYIPQDLVVDILSRLPVKSVMRFKCVSKSWYQMIVCPEFIKKHCNQSKSSNLKLIGKMSEGARIYDICFTLGGGEVSLSNMKEMKYPVIFNKLELKRQHNSVTIAGSSNGLICLIYRLHFRSQPQIEKEIIVLWNPSTGKYFQLPKNTDKLEFDEIASYGFGYNERTNDYKVACLATYNNSSIPFSKFSIFSLKSNKWKNFDDEEDFAFEDYVFWTKDTVTVNGILHWLVTNKSILAFNLETHGFRLIPPPKSSTPLYHVSLSVAFLNGIQYLVFNNDICSGQKWITTTDNYSSWTKLTSSSVFSIGQQYLEVEYPVKVKYFKPHLYFETLVQFDDKNLDVTFIEEQVGGKNQKKA